MRLLVKFALGISELSLQREEHRRVSRGVSQYDRLEISIYLCANRADRRVVLEPR